MLTPLGVLGGLRGVFYANIGSSGFNNQPYQFMSNSVSDYPPLIGYDLDFLGNATPVYGPPAAVRGLRLVDGRASYGIGLESFLLGFPMHFDWAWRTLFNRPWEDAVFYDTGGSADFRKPRFSVWIGYDF